MLWLIKRMEKELKLRDERKAEGRKKKRSKDKRRRILERNTTDKKRKCEERGKSRVKRTNAKGRVIICMSHRERVGML